MHSPFFFSPYIYFYLFSFVFVFDVWKTVGFNQYLKYLPHSGICLVFLFNFLSLSPQRNLFHPFLPCTPLDRQFMRLVSYIRRRRRMSTTRVCVFYRTAHVIINRERDEMNRRLAV